MSDGNAPATLADVIEYVGDKLAPDPKRKIEERPNDHWFDDVKDGFDAIWCAVARLELMLHCGMTSKQVGGPVLVDCKDKEKIAKKLKEKCPDFEDDVTVLRMLYVKKPPPGAPPWGN